jgi:glycosyltransferase involved in cell wall biosynthesis
VHVAIYTDDPDRGGVASYNHALALGLVGAGHRVSLIQSRSTGAAARAREAAGVAHEWIAYDTSADFARTLGDTSDADRAFIRLAPDVVVFSDGCALSNLAAKHVAAARQLPFVVVVHLAAPYHAERFPRALPALRGHYARARAVIAVSAETLGVTRRCFGLPADRGEVIVNGVAAEWFAPRDEAAAQALRRAHGIADDAVLSVTVARLAAVKGHAIQLPALERVTAPVVCAWIGDGELAPVLRAHVAQRGLAPRVHLTGARRDIATWLDAADVFTLTSFYEGMPISILEAMARGVPVVATAVSGVPEQLGDAGALLPDPAHGPAATSTRLAEIWDAWAASPALRRQIGDAGRARAAAQFRVEAVRVAAAATPP